MARLSVENLSFSYGKRQILHDISFTAEPGDFIALVGPNGVGKSTLFKCILGFLTNYQGHILIDGRDAHTFNRKELAREIAYIPQSSDQTFNYSVIELVMMGLAIRIPMFAVPGKEEEKLAMEALEQVGIAHLAYQGCGEISGGEYQLVLLARALVQKSKILVMDEPTAALDYGNQYRVMDRIASLSRNDFIIFMSAHDPNQVLLHANRAIILQKGGIRSDGAPREVMTEDTLSDLYGIEVHRLTCPDRQRMVDVCVPAGLGDK